MLKPVYVDDVKFELNFRQKYFTAENIARYVLIELNNEMMSNRELSTTEKLTLEHILPKNPDAEWYKSLTGKEPEELISLIGNLTLLEESVNREVGNSSFDNKKAKAYIPSCLDINKDVKEKIFWSRDIIEKRTERLAKLATKRWRVDY